ncbi:urea transporter 1-like isoform X2 [Xiphophorus maculatus]|uniref:Urea transporter n=1 Tax=Xiphophorus maculatus TaxID=8083 RepID=M3ZSB8_XIPMA|nr:urea transporter 1-like isoform X2 [Xiphophorus maculatus]XP_023193744.1 urea transporter 1-like isoform X2 [Xiphophorus maculatus]
MLTSTGPSNQLSAEPSGRCLRAVRFFTGDMRQCGEWVKRQVLIIQLLDGILRGTAQVMFVSNPVSGLLILTGLFLQNPWWALNSLLGTFVSTVSAILLRQNREAIFAGLHGYNGTLVGMLMAAFSSKGNWYWWLLFPNVFMSMLCPVISSALSSIMSKWDLPIFTLPFNILTCLHIAATGTTHPYFPEVKIQPKVHLHHSDSLANLSIPQLFLSVPVGVGQVFGCDSPWTSCLVLLALLLCSPAICIHALLGSTAGLCTGLALAAPLEDVYAGLWGYNSALSCIAIGGVFYGLTWQTHILSLICGKTENRIYYSSSEVENRTIKGVLMSFSALFCAYVTSATSKLMSVLALPACTWPFCLSTLIFLLLSSENPAICRLPLSAVSYPEENRHYLRHLRMSEKALSSCKGEQTPERMEG